MGEVIQFPRFTRVVVWHGVVTKSDIPEYQGVDVYFVDLEQQDGIRCGLWSGPGREEAFREARSLGLPVVEVPA